MVGEKIKKTSILKKTLLGLSLVSGITLIPKDSAADSAQRTLAEAFFMLGLPITASLDDIEAAYNFYKSVLVGAKEDPGEHLASNWLQIDAAYKLLQGNKEYFEQVIQTRSDFLNQTEVHYLSRESYVIEEFINSRRIELNSGLYQYEKWVGLTKLILDFETFLISEIKNFSREDIPELPQSRAFNRLGTFKEKLLVDLFFRSANETYALDALKTSNFRFTRAQSLVSAIEGYVSHAPLKTYDDFLKLEKAFRNLVKVDPIQNQLLDKAMGVFLRDSTRYLEAFTASLNPSQKRALEYFSHLPGESSIGEKGGGGLSGLQPTFFSNCGATLRDIFPNT